MSNVPYIATTEAVTVHINGRPKSLRLDTAQGQKLLAALRKKEHDFDEICLIADMPAYIAKYTSGRVTVDEKDQLYLDGEIVDFGVAGVITRMINDGADVSHLTLFLEDVARNPDKEIANHLYRFLEVGGLPITPDGCFHAFKRVQDDYFSYHSGSESVMVITFDENDVVKDSKSYVGKIPHMVGSMLVMDRTLCDPDRNRTCSVGLHACSFDYLQHYMGNAGRVVVVKIKPSEVTAIPSDYNDTKLRCCAMEIVDEISAESAAEHFKKVVEDRYTSQPESAATEEADENDLTLGWSEDDNGCGDPDCPDCYPISDIPNEEDEEDEEEAIGFVTVVRWAREDAEECAVNDSISKIFACEHEEGEHWGEVPEHLERTYMLHYVVSYVDNFELDEYASERAYDEGVVDGEAIGHEDFSGSDTNNGFLLCTLDGASQSEIPEEHMTAYDLGYAVGYLNAWNLF
jgi:hypothetical protein